MEQHNGSVSVYSKGEGLGTTFTVRLPCIVGDQGDEYRNEELFDIEPQSSDLKSSPPSQDVSRPLLRSSINAEQCIVTEFQQPPLETSSQRVRTFPSTKAAIAAAPEEERKVLRVLVVDDSDMNRKMVCKVLIGTKDFHCEQAVDGSVAVEIIRRQSQMQLSDEREEVDAPYDIILMDYQMPEMDGPTAIAEIRRLGYKGIILGLTGNALVSDKDVMLKSGADGVLVKPLNIQLFRQVLKDLSAR